MIFAICWRVLINFCMTARIDVPEIFNGIFRRIILKIIFSLGCRLASSYFLPEYFFYLGFRFWFGFSLSILIISFYLGFE
jgi:hypothetical protein